MRLLRFGFCALIAFSVLAHGAVEDWARAVLETGAGLLFLAWAVRFYFQRDEPLVISPLLPPLAAFAFIVFLQWPLRATASLYNTRIEFQLLLADLILLFLAVQLFRSLQDWRGFIWFGMSLGFSVSVFGILQHLTFNGKLYWIREMRYGGIPFGPFVNRNHFAGFAELVIPLALVPLILGRVRRERLPVVGFFAVNPVVALFLSASRGGIISFVVELLVLAFLVLFRRVVRKQLLAAFGILLAALLMVSWLGVGEILQRFSALQSLEATAGKRASMRRDTFKIFLDHPVLGTGLGTLQIVFPPYESLYDGRIVKHTHNDYLEALAETGILGGICCFWFLAVLLVQSWRKWRDLSQSFAGSLQLSGFVGCTGLLVHSLVDFNLHIPSNALLFFLMAHLATADIPQPEPSQRHPRHRNSRNP